MKKITRCPPSTEVEQLKAKVKELKAVITRIGMITSEEWGESDTVYEEELNHLIQKKTLKEFKY
jgi:hypothetical protein